MSGEITHRGMKAAAPRSIVYVLVMSCLFQLLGCSSFQAVEKGGTNNANPYGLSVGDRVLLVTKDAQHYEFEVTGFTDTAILGKHVELPLDQIKIAKRSEFDTLETAKSVGLGSLLALTALILFAAAALP